MTPHRHLHIAILTTLLCAFSWHLRAQEVHEPDSIKERINEIEERAKTEGGDLATALTVYKEALAAIGQRQAALQESAKFKQLSSSVPTKLANLESQAPDGDQDPPVEDGNKSLEEFERTHRQVEESLASAEEERDALAADQQSRASRAPTLPDLIAQKKAALTALASDPAPDEGTELGRARSALASAARANLEQQIEALEEEKRYYEVAADLQTAQIAANEQRVARLTRSEAAWREALDRKRSAAADELVADARAQLERFADFPRLAALAEDHLERARKRTGVDGLSQRIASAASDLASAKAELARVKKNHLDAMRRVKLLEDARLSIDPATGQLLRKHRYQLQPVRELRRELARSVRESAEAQLEQFEFEQERLKESPIESRLAGLLKSMPEAADQPEAAEQKASIRSLLENRKTLFDELAKDYRAYTNVLGEIAEANRRLGNETATYSRFIDERLLWIRSAPPISISDFEAEFHGVRKLASGDVKTWANVIKDDLVTSPVLWVLSGILLVAFRYRRQHHLRMLTATGESARKKNCRSFAPTGRALGYSIATALPLPGLLWFLTWRTAGTPPPIAVGLLNVSSLLTLWSIMRVLTRREGLLTDHLGISSDRLERLHRNLLWFGPTLAALLLFATSLPIANPGTSRGRIFFIAAMICVFAMAFRTLHPSRHLIAWRGKTGTRFAKICYALGLALPAGLILGAALGHFESVQELRVQIVSSVWLILLTSFFVALLHRWILVSRRRLSAQQAEQARKASKSSEGLDDATQAEEADRKEKVVEVSEQTTRLVRAAAVVVILIGLWGIWSHTVPAASALDKVDLWAGQPAATSTSPESAGGTTPGVTDKLTNPLGQTPSGSSASRGITLEDLLLSIVIFAMTFVAARNVPGLLELTILRHLRLHRSSSFALTTSVRYIIVMVGLIAAFGAIGITWSKVQWIAAAITLGVGFGLQEVFANFVAGIILLFERPIRIGDFVNVGNVSGQVKQIGTRATTIRDWSNKELIVPNKEFITGQVLNWTLSDLVIRLEIPVGIAYGSDTEKARRVLEETAKTIPLILEDPAPRAVFIAFGASSLDFELRVHIKGAEDHVATRSKLHFAIDNAFRKAGIEIAFPQTDLHIRSMPEDHVRPKPEVDHRPENEDS